MNPIRLLIVDDEPPAIERMTTLLAGIPSCQVAGCESRSDRVVQRCRELKPDALLLDIEMPGLNGIELAQHIRVLEPTPAIIFVTAYEEYAVDAFGLEAMDYLVKPVRAARLQQAIKRIALQPISSSQYVPGRIGERWLRIPLSTVRAFVASEKAVIVHSVEGVSMHDGSLKQLEQQYADQFMRVHRNALVSRKHIRSIFRDAQGNDHLDIDGIELKPEVSRRNRSELKRWLKTQ
ncbi:MAG: LytTR family DNA-binding domain-containing protein [Pseudomonadota bacterium]